MKFAYPLFLAAHWAKKGYEWGVLLWEGEISGRGWR